jgi:DTW domain-containing protein YfiP
MRFPPSLFACPKCWLLPGLCICNMMVSDPLQEPMPDTRKYTSGSASLTVQKTFKTRTRVVIHCHYGEWQRCSNTGSVAALSLPGSSEVLLRGYKPHDQRLDELLNDQTTTTALLWPGRVRHATSTWAHVTALGHL